MMNQQVPSVFVSVSLTATDDAEAWKELDQITDDFLENNAWNPTYLEQVAGALRYSTCNFFKKFIMRMIARKQGGDVDPSRDYEYTDWGQVKGIITKLEKITES